MADIAASVAAVVAIVYKRKRRRRRPTIKVRGIGDAGVYQNSTMCRALENNTLRIPPPQPLPLEHDEALPFVFVADEAFPLKTYIMKPYAHRGMNDTEKVFNYRLSRARRIVENAFGIMAARFRVF
jgi:hypothetical protein